MSEYQKNSIFWVETSKIQPNPFQPRREFEPRALDDLADSIRQYGILQPLVVTRKETLRPDNNGMDVSYELIAGERRLRAAKLAGLQQVPVIIRKETDNKIKLELAIIENLQREDLNPIDRALAFEQLYKEFNLTHVEIGKRMGKSRVYVSNSLRLLSLPEEIKKGLMAGRISEGHTRPLLMLTDRPEEQTTLYKEIMVKKMSVRDAEKVARKIAQDKVRKKEFVVDPKIRAFEKQLAENLGTRVHIEPKEKGGQITIDYFTLKDLESILASMQKVEREQSMMESYLSGEHGKVKEEIQSSTAFTFIQNQEQNVTQEPKIKLESSTIETPKEILPHHAPDTGTNLPSEHHEELPEYHKHPHTDITISHSELEAASDIDNNVTNTDTAVDKQEVPAEEIQSVNILQEQETSIKSTPDIVDEVSYDKEIADSVQHVPEEYTSTQHPVQNDVPYDPPRYQPQQQESLRNDPRYQPMQNNSHASSYQQPQRQSQIHYQQPVRKKSLFGRLFG